MIHLHLHVDSGAYDIDKLISLADTKHQYVGSTVLGFHKETYPLDLFFALLRGSIPLHEISFSTSEFATIVSAVRVAENMERFFPKTVHALAIALSLMQQNEGEKTPAQVIGEAMHAIGTHHMASPPNWNISDVIFRDAHGQNLCNLSEAITECWKLEEKK